MGDDIGTWRQRARTQHRHGEDGGAGGRQRSEGAQQGGRSEGAARCGGSEGPAGPPEPCKLQLKEDCGCPSPSSMHEDVSQLVKPR